MTQIPARAFVLEEREDSPHSSHRAELLTVINAVTEGERERDSANREGEKVTLSLRQVMHYGLFWGVYANEKLTRFLFVLYLFISHSVMGCRFVL